MNLLARILPVTLALVCVMWQSQVHVGDSTALWRANELTDRHLHHRHRRRGLRSLRTRRARVYKCYSCMSLIGHKYWDYLKEFYYPPRTYTPQCDGEGEGVDHIGLARCSARCVTIQYRMNLLGILSVPLYIRGCANEVARDGYTDDVEPFIHYARQQSCKAFAVAKALRAFENDLAARNTQVLVCPCLGDRCNTYFTIKKPLINVATRPTPVWMLLTAVSLSLATNRGFRLGPNIR